AGDRKSSTPESRCVLLSRRIRRSPSVRRSVNAACRASSRAKAASASAETGRRGGAEAHPPSALAMISAATTAARGPRLLLLGLGRATPNPELIVLSVLDLLPHRVRGGAATVDTERALPCRDGLGGEAVL